MSTPIEKIQCPNCKGTGEAEYYDSALDAEVPRRCRACASTGYADTRVILAEIYLLLHTLVGQQHSDTAPARRKAK